MIGLLSGMLVVMLFILIKESIAIWIGERNRLEILCEIEGNKIEHNKYIQNRELIRNICIGVIIFLIAVFNNYSVFTASFFGVISVGLLIGVKRIKRSINKKQVLQDLMNVGECLRVQLSSNIPLGKALRGLPELCENKELANLLTNIYLEYELSKFTISDSATALQSTFNYPEIRIFISALNQQIQGASAIESFDNLINILKEEYIDFLEDATKSKMAIMTMGVFTIVINIAAIGIYPVIVEAFDAINVMLK